MMALAVNWLLVFAILSTIVLFQSVAVIELDEGSMSGLPAPMRIIILIFGLGGAAIWVWVCLSMLRPLPVLTLKTREIARGEDLELQWHFKSWPSGIGRFRLLLECVAVKIDEAGERKSLFGAVCYTHEIFSGRRTHQIASGSATIVIPESEPPTRDREGTRTYWRIRPVVECGPWPDSKASVEILVTP